MDFEELLTYQSSLLQRLLDGMDARLTSCSLGGGGGHATAGRLTSCLIGEGIGGPGASQFDEGGAL